jgi:deazaflavin-dependent oxidoreductase (nitroreductase family)
VEAVWRLHRWIFRASGGLLGGRLGGLPILLLTTRGRKSGEAREVALGYLREGEAYVVIASNAGEDSHPGWWLNLMAEPEARIYVGGEELPVLAREAQGEVRQAIWARLIHAQPSYNRYQERTSRRIPVVILELQTPQAATS